MIKKAGNYTDQAIAGLGPIVEVIGLSPTTFDNMQKRLNAAGSASASLSYPLTIDTIKWESLKELFTEPLAYIRKIYHVEDYAEATELLSKIMALVRVFNPEVPDFASIKSMLISLVRKMEDRVLTAAKDAAGELWKKIEPFVMFIRMMIELLEQIADKLKDSIEELLTEYRFMLAMLGKELEEAFAEMDQGVKAIEYGEKELIDYAKGHVRNIGNVAGDIWDGLNDSAAKAYGEFRKESGKIGLGQYVNIDEGALKRMVQSCADDLVRDTGKQIPLSEIEACVQAIKVWFRSTTDEVYSFVSPTGWCKRFDNVVCGLEKVFREDVSAVTSLVSAKGAKRLAGNFKGTLQDTFSKIDISDYIKIGC